MLESFSRMPPGLLATDWSRQNRTWYEAVQVEKRMMGIILFLIVLVGAFGLVSSLVMTVNSKRSDIAILRTQGATRGSIMRIFMVQGAFIGTAGVLIGVGVGLLIAARARRKEKTAIGITSDALGSLGIAEIK